MIHQLMIHQLMIRQLMVARWLSIIFHPFVVVGVMVGTVAAARQAAGDAVRTAGAGAAVQYS